MTLWWLHVYKPLSCTEHECTVKHVFFAHVYFSRFELHSMLIIFTVLGPFPCILDVFLGICRLLSSLLFARSWKIHGRESFGWPFANNRHAQNIPVLQYVMFVSVQQSSNQPNQVNLFDLYYMYIRKDTIIQSDFFQWPVFNKLSRAH